MMKRLQICAAAMAGFLALAWLPSGAAATDYQDVKTDLTITSGTGTKDPEEKEETVEKDDTLVIGLEKKYTISLKDAVVRNNTRYSFSSEELAWLVSERKLSTSVMIPNGKGYFAEDPSLKPVDNVMQLKVRFDDTYGVEPVTAKLKARFTAEESIYRQYYLSFEKNGRTCYLTRDFKETAGALGSLFALPDVGAAVKQAEKLGYDVSLVGRNLLLRKGDTVTGALFELAASYGELDSYGSSITLTTSEVDNREVVAKGDSLYSKSDSNNQVSVFFGETGDSASVTFRTLSTQKDINFYYSLEEIPAVTEKYPGVDFSFISFLGQKSGCNVLSLAGSMQFPAINGPDTVVYTYDGKQLKELKTEYSSIDDSVTASGIKNLTTYVIAEKKLF